MKFQMKNKSLLYNPFFLTGILSVVVLIITIQNLSIRAKTFGKDTTTYTAYNNYIIFKQSFFHLIEGKDLYQLYPVQQWDYYKYSPTFSFFMAPLAMLPDAAGLFIWNLLNVLILFMALWKLPVLQDKKKFYMLMIILIELITSVINSQSNAMIAGLILLAFLFLESKHIALATLCIVLTVFIKIFGVVAFALFMFYPNKGNAFLYSIGWMALLAILPMVFIPFSQLIFLYKSWLHLLQNDHSTSIGLSVAGWLYTWFSIESKNSIVLIGAMLFCLPFLKYKFFNELKFKLFFLSSVLIWIVIFNHKAESPTYIIAVTGVTIWVFSQRLKLENLILVSLVAVFTILSPTDIFPKSIRTNFVEPYVLKAIPCILVWGKIMFDLMMYKSENTDERISFSENELL